MDFLAAEPRSIAGPLFRSECLWNDLADIVFDGVGLAGFNCRANAYFLTSAAVSRFVL